MGTFPTLNLIHVFEFYLAAVFLLSTWRRIEQYRAIGGLLFDVPGRWPRLFQLVQSHRMVFLTWKTLLPTALALALYLIHSFASRLIWPKAHLTPSDLFGHWALGVFVVTVGLGMIAVDAYFLIRVPVIDTDSLKTYFDQAEYWLSAWTGHVLQHVTLGWLNPRQMVNDEVRKALVAASELLNRSLWWMAVQVSFRVAFGLILWLTWGVIRRGTGG